MTIKAKDLKVKLKKKRPRPKVWRPEKVKVAKRAKIPKATKSKPKRRKSECIYLTGSDEELLIQSVCLFVSVSKLEN